MSKLTKQIIIAVVAVLIVVGGALLIREVAGASRNEEPKKVLVCKYVGKPNFDERLKEGKNPISVSINSIKDYQGVGSYFADAQGRSYVVALDYGKEVDCPVPEVPEKCALDESILATDPKCVVCEYDDTILAGNEDCKEPEPPVEPPVTPPTPETQDRTPEPETPPYVEDTTPIVGK